MGSTRLGLEYWVEKQQGWKGKLKRLHRRLQLRGEERGGRTISAVRREDSLEVAGTSEQRQGDE